MKRTFPLLLALLLGLSACAAPSAAPAAPVLDGGVWTTETDRSFSVDAYTASQEIRAVPADWVLPDDLRPEGNVRTEASGDQLLRGSFDGSSLNGFTVVKYLGENKVRRIYTFSDGITVVWQPFFSPDGGRIAFPWKAAPSDAAWNLRVADLSSGGAEDLTLPAGAAGRDLLLCAWQEDGALLVTSVNMDYDAAENSPRTWLYTFPAEQS